MYSVSFKLLEKIIEGYLKIAKKLSGELVILNKKDDEADEYIISNINDLKFLKISKGDMIELTIYVDDEDEYFEEFVIGEIKNIEKLEKNILSKLPNKIDINSFKSEIKEQKNSVENNHFSKYMKKNK
ncbi:MAG: hypothetical protein ACRC1R_08490 [Cetobacterium sp.]|uniref:hypothetical protein n=1 Tax=Cetobacterium sp. TaxID=2071632 RepID=UPI003F3CADD0